MNPVTTATLFRLRHELEEALKLGGKMRAVGGLIPAVVNFPAYWAKQVEQYPAKGPKGISYFKGVLSDDVWVDCLLYRDEKGKLIGVLNHYPFDMPPYESKGNINVMVDPAHQGEGIGKLLLKEAMKRWDVNLAQQQWTPSGDKLRQSIQKADEQDWLVWRVGEEESEAWRIRALNPDDARDVYRDQLGLRGVPNKGLMVKPAPKQKALKLGKKMRTISTKESVMNAAVNLKLEALRGALEADLSESLVRHAFLYLASDGNWYLELADAEHGSQRDSNAYGPFPSEDAIYSFMDNFSNPGGYWSDNTGKRPPPEKSPNGSPVRKVKKRGSGWDFDYPSTKRKLAPYRF